MNKYFSIRWSRRKRYYFAFGYGDTCELDGPLSTLNTIPTTGLWYQLVLGPLVVDAWHPVRPRAGKPFKLWRWIPSETLARLGFRA